ncbi:MAG: hypothetical protein ONB48_16190 [candidate division KSB1 bacterium]|nr:hypothetical protein [candidate division KSB1 bacterium]MDZ7274289.1 hypothetical protein [candidate division KSB1 bacterium]MDZ7287189.1 hypothetical protein [candidate division KSB1 bacterium]MDZ7296886.1 hypothetical protein [candidate division KSB1 bacterium]MDZ7306009.1 hypothetical protein [candidate division KSB1 bacterium]
MTLELSVKELELLQRIVQQYFMNLREEIYHTDSSLFKDDLKVEKAQIEAMLNKIATAVRAAATA